MRELPFVDAHVHFWDLGRIDYPWLTPPFASGGLMGSVEAIAADYGPGEYRADAASWNVAGAVHIDAGAAPAHAVAETRWLQQLNAQGGLPSAIVAYAALQEPGLDAILEAHCAAEAVRGIRQIVNFHPDPQRTYLPADLTVEDAWQKGFAKLARYGLGFDLQAYPAQFPGLARLFARHDDIPVVVNHAGMPFHDERDAWREGMRALAEIPGCAVKVSGFGITDHDWSVDSIRPYVLEIVELFGADRVMVASDFPTDKLYADFDRCLDAYAEIFRDFSDHEQRAIWGGNADRIYRLGIGLQGG